MTDPPMPVPPDTPGPVRGVWIGRLTLALAIVAVYATSLPHDFVWDDRVNFLEHEAWRGLGWRQVAWAFTTFHGGHYQPLSWITLALDHALWGMEPAGYRATNVVLHVLNAWLLFAVARVLLREGGAASGAGAAGESLRVGGAFVAAAAFALHPMRVESVVWITERRDVLSALCFLLAIACYLRAVARGLPGRLEPRWLAGAAALTVLSLLAKAWAMAMPAVLLVLDVYPLRRHSAHGAHGQTGLPRLLLEKVPFVLLSAATAAAALAAQSSAGALTGLDLHGWPQRLAQAAYGTAYYLRATFAQLAWYPLYERPFEIDPAEPRFVAGAVATLGLTVACVLFRRRWPALLAAWIAYLALLAPVLGIAQSGFQLVADRYGYLACLPWFVVCGAGFAALLARASRAARAVSSVAAAALLVSWATLAWNYTRHWKDDEALWRHAARAGESAMARNNLGYMALHRGERAAALDELTRALESKPTYRKPLENLVVLLYGETRAFTPEALARAERAVRRTLEFHASNADARFALGSILLQQSRDAPGPAARPLLEEAAEQLDRCVAARPEFAQAWFKWGVARYALGDLAGAVARCRRAVEIDPAHAEAWTTLGVLAVESRRWAEAAQALERATELDPGSSLAWTAWGTATLQLGDVPRGVERLRRALEIDPANERARKILTAIEGGARAPS